MSQSIRALQAGLAGATATFVGIGLGRFAYTPLVPAMVADQWVSPVQAGYLGAANLLGYLVGAVAANHAARRLGVLTTLAVSFAAVIVSLLLCAWPANLLWLSLWRLVAGVAGAVLMVVGGSTAVTAVPAANRARTAALAFSGVGLGILAAAMAIPALLQWGVSNAWLGLGVAGTVLAGPVWPLWHRLTMPADSPANQQSTPTGKSLRLAVLLITAAYALDAVGFVPHTIYWVDFLARSRELGMAAGSFHWALFGVGATAGAIMAGETARAVGWHRGLVLALWIKAGAVALPVFVTGQVLLALSSVAVGALIPGMVTLVSGRLSELSGGDDHRRIWGRATAALAIAQAAAGYGYAALLSLWGDYELHFLLAAGALTAAAVLAGLSGQRQPTGVLEPVDR